MTCSKHHHGICKTADKDTFAQLSAIRGQLDSLENWNEGDWYELRYHQASSKVCVIFIRLCYQYLSRPRFHVWVMADSDISDGERHELKIRCGDCYPHCFDFVTSGMLAKICVPSRTAVPEKIIIRKIEVAYVNVNVTLGRVKRTGSHGEFRTVWSTGTEVGQTVPAAEKMPSTLDDTITAGFMALKAAHRVVHVEQELQASKKARMVSKPSAFEDEPQSLESDASAQTETDLDSEPQAPLQPSKSSKAKAKAKMALDPVRPLEKRPPDQLAPRGDVCDVANLVAAAASSASPASQQPAEPCSNSSSSPANQPGRSSNGHGPAASSSNGPASQPQRRPDREDAWALTRTARKATCAACRATIPGHTVRLVHQPNPAGKDPRVWGQLFSKYYHVEAACIAKLSCDDLADAPCRDEDILKLDIAPLPKSHHESPEQYRRTCEQATFNFFQAVEQARALTAVGSGV